MSARKRSHAVLVMVVMMAMSAATVLPLEEATVGKRELPEQAGADWWSRVQTGIRDQEYRVQVGPAHYRPERGEVWQAPNRALDVRLYFDAEGVEILERSTEDAETVLRLELEGWGREGRLDRSPAGALREEDGRLKRLRGALTESYANLTSGIELSWQVDGPVAGEGDLLLVLGLEGASARRRGGGIEIRSAGGRTLVMQAVQAVDAAGTALPAEVAVAAGGRLVLRVDDRGALYPATVKTILTGTVDALLEAQHAYANMGNSVASAGDVNGDGFSDVIIGALYYDNGETNEGIALVFLGSANGVVGSGPSDAHALLESNQDSAYMGDSVASAGDVNGDGFSDVIVGAKSYDHGETNEGIALVFLGSASGIVGSNPADAHALIEANQDQATLGRSVASAGDVDGDGFSDVIIGVANYDNPDNYEGIALVFLGSATGITGSTPADAHALLEADQAGASFGWSVASAGDVDGDGFSDVIVGAPGYDNAVSNVGAAFVYLGSASGITASTAADAEFSLESGRGYVFFGHSVASAGDVNGDGYADVLVGAPYWDNGEFSEGIALVFLGSASGVVGSNNNDAHALIESNQGDVYWGFGAELGRSVSSAGDVNGDGFADIIIGATGYSDGESGEGAALIFHGSAPGIIESPWWSGAPSMIGADQDDARLGTGVASAGDVNGDGFSDVVVGAPYFDNGEVDEGVALVFLGSGSGIVGSSPADAHAVIESNQTEAHMGRSVASAGDVNGDGFADIIAGAVWHDNGETDEGIVVVFHGSASGITGSSPADADALIEADQVGARLGRSVASAGDVNGDGFSDVICGGHYYSDDETEEGVALVFLGSAAGVVGSNPADAHAQLAVDQVGAHLGSSVASAGDVNGDGYADVIVGAQDYDDGETDEGAALVFYGSPSGITGSGPADADAVIASDQVSANLGFSVASAGDVNSDGYADIIVGAYQFDHPENGEGVALVFLGSSAGIVGSGPGDAHALLDANQDGAGLGRSVATAGDVNGDGFSDVIVGANLYDNGSTDEGVALIFLGSDAGIIGSSPADAHAMIQADQADARLGISVAGAGDVNGDGFADVIVGALRFDQPDTDEGVALIYVGNGDAGRPVLARQLDGDTPSTPVQPWAISGVDGGFSVSMIATSPRGRERVRLEVEACPPGLPFGSPSCSTWADPEWHDTTATSDGIEIESTAAGLAPGELYRWRARTLHAPFTVNQSGVTPPPNPAHGPWRRLQGQAFEADIRIPLRPDLVVAVDNGQVTSVPGESVIYTIQVSNVGPLEVSGVTVSDPLPGALLGATWTCTGSGGGVCTAGGSGDISDVADLPLGSSVTYTLAAEVDPAATGSLVNAATVTLPVGSVDATPGDNTDDDADTLTPTADLAITKDDGLATAVPGEEVTYIMTASNLAGPSVMAGTQVTDLFPAHLTDVTWTCAGASGGACGNLSGSGNLSEGVDLPPGASVTFAATGTVVPGATGSLDNAASVQPPLLGIDPNQSNNTATDMDTLTPEVDLSITKGDGTDMAVLGWPSLYTIVASNPGPSDVLGATVSDVFPVELGLVVWICSGSDGGNCAASGSGDIADTVDLPAGASVTYTAAGTVDAGATGRTLDNTATVTCPAGVTERDPSNNTATDSNTLWEVIFADDFESGTVSNW